ncbi:MAG TPA: hypothetical protein VFL61_05530 [Gaiellaceae bacterium]|nr:hypothetical protein [Gaiellaceae bacterium]
MAEARPAVDELDRRHLLAREPGDQLSVAPGVQGRLKRLLRPPW